MRTLLCVSLLAMVPVRGEEAGSSMREKLRAKILESVPPPPVKQPDEKKAVERAATTPVIMMDRVIVSGTKQVRDVATAIAQQEQDRKDERFSPVNGGMIGSIGPMKVGSWFSSEEGWTFLRMRAPPPRRRVEETQTMLKDLQELADMAGKPAAAKSQRPGASGGR